MKTKYDDTKDPELVQNIINKTKLALRHRISKGNPLLSFFLTLKVIPQDLII
jgi:hypothetical protein